MKKKHSQDKVVPPINFSAEDAPIRSVFISYAREDSDWASEKVRTLRQVGICVFHDIDSIRSGDNWPEALRHAISSADRFILGWSANANNSDWVRTEIEEAIRVRTRESIARFILIDFLDTTPLPTELQHTQGERSKVTRAFHVPAAVLIGLAFSFVLWTLSRHSFIGSHWSFVAGLLLAVGITLLYVYYASPEHLRRVRTGFWNMGSYLSNTTPRILLRKASLFLDSLYGGSVWSKRSLARTALIASLAVAIPNLIATGWFLSRGENWSNHYVYLLRYYTWLQILVVFIGPLVLNAVADMISVSVSRVLIFSASQTGGVKGMACLLTAIPFTVLLASAPLIALTSIDHWTSYSAWFTDLSDIIIEGNSSIYNDVEIILFRVLFISTAVSACFPLLAVTIVFVGAIVAFPGKGALFRAPGRMLLVMSRDATGPLAVTYSCLSVFTLFLALCFV